MGEALSVLRQAQSVLVVDWPSEDVPHSLVRAGYRVYVKNGPRPRDYAVGQLQAQAVLMRALTDPPERVDLLYAHRPLAELEALCSLARALGARALWRQSGLIDVGTRDPRGCWLPAEDSRRGRELAAAAGLRYVDHIYIGDVLRELPITGAER
jgi:predicted CoA-binding protein